ncbi:MAG: hypothetical protein DWQ51_14860 [Microcystis wesenbergii TW10]|uniref:Uncharacterized protein n=1 Tax=Microcystis wesenbergii TW10 TaxID=2060474 RepID=A0A3E0LT66_9CHRO|nr:MAG: hypothetical protein DWQ51_14860 [Microcystis wesenbergii TW10]
MNQPYPPPQPPRHRGGAGGVGGKWVLAYPHLAMTKNFSIIKNTEYLLAFLSKIDVKGCSVRF